VAELLPEGTQEAGGVGIGGLKNDEKSLTNFVPGRHHIIPTVSFDLIFLRLENNSLTFERK
jgi:hypothetical protein